MCVTHDFHRAVVSDADSQIVESRLQKRMIHVPCVLTYRFTRNLRAIRLLLVPTKLETTVRYLRIRIDDALEMAEQTDA